VSGVLKNIEKKPVNSQNQHFYKVEYTLPDGSMKLLPLWDIHCCPGKWIDTTPTPAALLYGIDMPEKDLGSVNMLEAPSIQHSDDSTFDESQPICELFPDSEPVPAPVLEEQVPAQQAVEQAEEEQVQSDDDSDDASDVKPSVATDNIPWYTEMEYCESNINGTVNPIKWSFKDEMGEDMSEDDDVGSERSVLDYFLACFPPNAMKHIMYLTNKKLEEDKQPEMGMGELLKFFGVLILRMQFEFSNCRDLWSPNSNNWFISSLAIGMTTGMSKHWFDILLANMTFATNQRLDPRE
jgi:Transposase IS4